MGMEVVWIRQFTPYLGNVVYAFGGVLAVLPGLHNCWLSGLSVLGALP
jgi:hypothetical protein